MGDDEGLLIGVDVTRYWFPEQRSLPNAQAVQVKLKGAHHGGPVVENLLRWSVSSHVDGAPHRRDA